MTRDASLAGADAETGRNAGEAAERETPQLVVVGASAGGVEALTALVGTLPETLNAPLIIAQHLDPRRPSHLREILERRTALPVVLVEERERLQPGKVYVVPPDRHVDVRAGEGGGPEVVAEMDGSRAQPAEEADGSSQSTPALPKPSIDRLLRSAAEVYGEGLIAVVLTGSGSDGAQGARTVKERGGTVIIQNPETASFPSMPQSLAPATVDVVADLETMGPLLHELLEAPRLAAAPAEARALRGVLDQLRERSGIDFSAYKEPTILRRLQRRMVTHNVPTVTEYARFLQRHPDEHERLVSSFLIKVTGFFRDPELYAHLREVVVPELVAAARERGRELRFWSAGCATGEEAYSLAILAADVLGEELETFTVRVFATDLDNEAIAFARHGVYPAAALANMPEELVERHFIRLGTGEYEIRKRVRALTVFGQHDLGQRAPFPRIDLALCRNVLIYFTTELQRRALQLFAFALREGGYLALGKAETVSPLAEYFSPTDSALKLYRRHRTGPVSIPAARIRDVAPAPPAGPLPGGTMGGSGSGSAGGGLGGFSRISPAPALLDARAGRGARQTLRARGAPERMDGLVAQLPVGVVVVDRRYDVQSINTAARRLLGIHGAAVEEDFVHLAQSVPPGKLRAAIEETLRPQPGEDGREVMRHVLPVEPPVGEVRFLQISVHPYRHEQNGEALAVVLISDVTMLEQARLRLAEERAAMEAVVQRQEQQISRLMDANRQLLQANDELTTINTTLRSANEELLLSHEEAQAATEEVETLNEELQATNEEQETLNEELQATVEELNTTNDDLHSRSLELHELTLALEAEREQLRAVLSSMSDAVLVLDRAGTPMLANEAYEAALGPLRVTTRPLEMLGRAAGHAGVGTLAERAATGEPFTTQIRHVGTDGAVREYEARGRALSGAAGRQGTVITFREVGP